MKTELTFTGFDEAIAKLKALQKPIAIFEPVVAKNTLKLMAEATYRTPVDTGQLRGSIHQNVSGLKGMVYYTVFYAPHVELGHVLVNGGYVEGQHFLQLSVNVVNPMFKNDLMKALEEAINS